MEDGGGVVAQQILAGKHGLAHQPEAEATAKRDVIRPEAFDLEPALVWLTGVRRVGGGVGLAAGHVLRKKVLAASTGGILLGVKRVSLDA